MMEKNQESEGQTPLRKKKMSDFLKSMLWTAIPIVVLGAVSATARMAGTGNAVSIAMGAIAIGLWVLAILVCIGSAIARRGQIAAGVLAGAAIGLVGLGLSCSAMSG